MDTPFMQIMKMSFENERALTINFNPNMNK